MQKKSKLLNIPVEYLNQYQHYKECGLTSLSFSAFIIEALRKALEENKAIELMEIMEIMKINL